VSGGIFILVLIGLLFVWLLLIRPQRRRQNDQLAMQDHLAVGDEIVTAGGMYGTVEAIDEDEVAVEIADGVVVRVARRAVAGVMPDEADEEEDEESEAHPETESEPEPANRS
jgi:preprotein translocase subunit YajC